MPLKPGVWNFDYWAEVVLLMRARGLVNGGPVLSPIELDAIERAMSLKMPAEKFVDRVAAYRAQGQPEAPAP